MVPEGPTPVGRSVAARASDRPIRIREPASTEPRSRPLPPVRSPAPAPALRLAPTAPDERGWARPRQAPSRQPRRGPRAIQRGLARIQRHTRSVNNRRLFFGLDAIKLERGPALTSVVWRPGPGWCSANVPRGRGRARRSLVHLRRLAQAEREVADYLRNVEIVVFAG